MPISQRQLFLQHLAIPAYIDHPIEIERAKGIYLFGTDGKKYIDLVSGVSVSNLGPGHPAICIGCCLPIPIWESCGILPIE